VISWNSGIGLQQRHNHDAPGRQQCGRSHRGSRRHYLPDESNWPRHHCGPNQGRPRQFSIFRPDRGVHNPHVCSPASLFPAGNYYLVLVSANTNPLSMSPEGSSNSVVTAGRQSHGFGRWGDAYALNGWSNTSRKPAQERPCGGSHVWIDPRVWIQHSGFSGVATARSMATFG